MSAPELPFELTFTPYRFSRFKKMYDRAVSDGKTEFLFQGQTVLVDYAKFVIEHLEPQFNAAKNKRS